MIVKELFEQGDSFRDKIFDFYEKEYAIIEDEDLEKDIFPEGMTDKEDKYNFLRTRLRKMFDDGYDDILKIDPIVNGKEMCVVYPIKYAGSSDRRTYDASFIEVDDFASAYERLTPVTTLDELYDTESYTSISMMYMDREEVLGMIMSETSLELYPIEEVIGAIFFEMTWFGYTNEEYSKNMNKELEIMNAQLSGTYYPEEDEEDVEDEDHSEYTEFLESLFDDENDEEKEKEFEEYSKEVDDDAIINHNIQVEFYNKLYDNEFGGRKDE